MRGLGLDGQIQLVAEQPVEQIAVVQQGLVFEEVLGQRTAFGTVGVETDKDGAPVGRLDPAIAQFAFDLPGCQLLVEDGLQHALEPCRVVERLGQRLGHVETDPVLAQGHQGRGGQGGQCQPPAHMAHRLGKGAGNVLGGATELGHGRVGADLVGRVMIDAGVGLGTGPGLGGGGIICDQDRDRVDHVIAGELVQPAQATAPRDDLDAGVGFQPDQVGEQAADAQAVGQLVDLGLGWCCAGVQGADRQLGQRDPPHGINGGLDVHWRMSFCVPLIRSAKCSARPMTSLRSGFAQT